jgi:hypothetical protein
MIRVSRLSIAPVRSLALVHPESIELGPDGVAADRRFYLVDDGGRLVDRLVAGALVQVGAETDAEGTWLRLTFPDGTVLEGDIRLGDAIRSEFYSRLAVGRIVEGPWASAIAPYARRNVRLIRCDLPAGTRRRADEDRARNTVSLVSDGSLRELARHLGVPAVDARRFRMLIELEGAEAHQEDTWIGGRVVIGTAELAITKPDGRCAITTQDPDTGRRDLDTLRAILRYRGFRAGDPVKKLDFGVLGEVLRPGRISVGDAVEIRAPAPVSR